MPNPTNYTPAYSFVSYQSANPALPLPAPQVDNEHAMLSSSIGTLVDAIIDVRRSDGQLKNQSVGPDQLSSALTIGFTNRGGWVLGTIYNAGDGVVYGGTFYSARSTHTGTALNRPDVDPSTWNFLFTFASITLADGSVTPPKLDAAQAAGFRAVLGLGSFATLSAVPALGVAEGQLANGAVAVAKIKTADGPAIADLLDVAGATVVAAATLDLDSATGVEIDVSGNTGVNGVTLGAGKTRWVRFAGTPLITVSASLVGNAAGVNIQIEAGDLVKFRGYAAGLVRFYVQRLSGRSVTPVTIPVYVATRTALKALDTTKDTAAILTESGRPGIFLWTAGNYATPVTTDTAEGIYVKANALASSAGAWVRAYDGPINIEWFGAIGDGTTNCATAIQCALNVAGLSGTRVYVPAGIFKSTADLVVPVGNLCVDIQGDNWQTSQILFSGGGVTHGLYYLGTAYEYCGALRDIFISGTSATRGITYYLVNHPYLERVIVKSFAGAGVYFDFTLMASFVSCLVSGCGSATEGQVVVDHSTTFKWDHSRISGKNANTLSGLMIDDTSNVTILGGDIETTGVPIRASSKSGRTTGCITGAVVGMDIENPVGTYIEFGNGWDGTATLAAAAWSFTGINGSPSGAASIPNAVWLKGCLAFNFSGNNFAQPGSPTSNFWLEGANNRSIYIAAHRNQYGFTWPWVMENSAQRKDAGPRMPFNSDETNRGLFTDAQPSISGANPSTVPTAQTAQGGYADNLWVLNGSAVNMATLTGGRRGAYVTLISTNANTTIVHGTGADQFRTRGAANFLMLTMIPYRFWHDGTSWGQVS